MPGRIAIAAGSGRHKEISNDRWNSEQIYPHYRDTNYGLEKDGFAPGRASEPLADPLTQNQAGAEPGTTLA